MSAYAVGINARAMARQLVSDLRDVARDLGRCADVVDRIRLTGAEPSRAAARFVGSRATSMRFARALILDLVLIDQP